MPDTEPQSLHRQDLHIQHRDCCDRIGLCTLYIPPAPSSELRRREAQEKQATPGAAAMGVEQCSGEGRRGREKETTDVIIALPFRIMLMLLPRVDLGYKLIAATGWLVHSGRPDFNPENGEDGGKGEGSGGRNELKVDQALDLELSLVSGQLVGAIDVCCSVSSAWTDRHLCHCANATT